MMADLDRVLRALNHPIRRQILAAIIEEPRSAKSLSREFKMELSSVAYHLNQVLNRECGLVELVETVQRRGALEKFFRIKVEALRENAADPAGGGKGKTATLEECILALAVGVASLPEDCPSSLLS